ncbi:hydroxypyruvate isomerase [Izhakiella australiensis]|uniref:Hydroxypyruvate isomerase n=1 Tax=Izhakiella australiensis TaxID=1926881 RepID=A0A1S8YT97_9GAMM|nr:hydroxypyruvate isomerase [Izhakiella australiensis]OON42052.1 hydroxypyruvate isomerase [Izhakiella australiensis]
MLRFSANLSMLFQEYDFLDRFDKAAASGFRGVEFMFPYDYEAQVLKQKISASGVEHTLHNLPAGDWAAGERGVACIPGREPEFRQGVSEAVRYAKVLGNRKINCLVGKTPDGFSAQQIHSTLVENLRYAARELAKENILLLIEPLNTFDMPGFHLCGTQQALALIKEVGSDNLKIQYDIYHMQRMEGELTHTMQTYASSIGHLQVADNPKRGEPGSGEINYDFLFKIIEQSNYDGWVGCEYKPLATTEAGLQWLNRYR